MRIVLLGNIFLFGAVIWFFLRQKMDFLQIIKNIEYRLQKIETEHQKTVKNINDSGCLSSVLGTLQETTDVLEESKNKVNYPKSGSLAKTCELPKPLQYPATLLLIDNDTRFTFAFAKAIHGRIDKVLIVSEATKALHQIRTHPEVNIVLINAHMPTLDVSLVLAQIRSVPRNSKLQIAVLVNNADANNRILAVGANVCLEKSIGIENLCLALEELMQKI
ncbi:hypothetical protein CCP3SC1AL1_820002 [Gammaproteobacteria bacterium]